MRYTNRCILYSTQTFASGLSLWMCFRRRSYLTVSVNWLDTELSPHHRCLAARRVPRNRVCANSLTSLLTDVLNDWSLTRDRSRVVASGTAAVVKEALGQVVVTAVIQSSRGSWENWKKSQPQNACTKPDYWSILFFAFEMVKISVFNLSSVLCLWNLLLVCRVWQSSVLHPVESKQSLPGGREETLNMSAYWRPLPLSFPVGGRVTAPIDSRKDHMRQGSVELM